MHQAPRKLIMPFKKFLKEYNSQKMHKRTLVSKRKKNANSFLFVMKYELMAWYHSTNTNNTMKTVN